MAHIRFTIEVELEKVSGKFVAKDDLAAEIVSELEAADPGNVYADESEYGIESWDVGYE